MGAIVKLVAFTCPSCGAHLDVDVESKTATCQYCGAVFPVEDETQSFKLEGAAQAGYEFEKGRQRAQAEAAAQQRQRAPQQPYPQRTYPPPPAPVQQTPVKPKKKRKTWLWVLGWICIFPVPLTIIMLRKKDMKPAVRYGIIAAAWLVYLAIGASGNGDKTQNKVRDTSSETVGTQEPEPATTADEATVASAITLVAGQEDEYSQSRTLNAGTEFEETQLVYYVPAGTYEVQNTGDYRTQVSVYQGVTTNDAGWEEPANTGDVIVLEPGEKGTITVPEGYYVDILEPTQITLTLQE